MGMYVKPEHSINLTDVKQSGRSLPFEIRIISTQLSRQNISQLDLLNETMDLEPRNPSSHASESIPRFNEMSLIKTVVLSLMFVISFLGNTATLFRMYKMRRRKSTINTLILQLATADLIVTFFCNVTDAVWASTIQWYAGNFMCKTVKFLQVFGLYLSTYIIVIISLDRCCAILDPMSRNKAPRRVKIMILTAWVLSALFSLPQAFIFRVLEAPFKEVRFYQCVTHDFYTQHWQERLYSTLSVLFMFIIPLCAMITAYILIFYTIAKKARDLQDSSQDGPKGSSADVIRVPVRSQLFRKAKVKSLRMTALIVAAFIICWTPYYVVFIIYTYWDHKQLNPRTYIWIFFFGMANSMVNPLIYGAFHICGRRRKRVSSRRSGGQSLKMQSILSKVPEPHLRDRLVELLSSQRDATMMPVNGTTPHSKQVKVVKKGPVTTAGTHGTYLDKTNTESPLIPKRKAQVLNTNYHSV